MGIVLGWVFETLAGLVCLAFQEKYPRLSWAILAVLLVLMAALLVWAFWLDPAA